MSSHAFDTVMKFGGAALADGAAVERACRIIAQPPAGSPMTYSASPTQGGGGEPRPVVVVSAHLGVTSLLEGIARGAALGAVEMETVRVRHRTLLRQLGLPGDLLDRYFSKLGSILHAIRARGALHPGERDLVLSFGERMSARVVTYALRRMGVAATPVDSFDLGLTTDSNHGQARPLPGVHVAVREALSQVPGVPVVTGFLAKDSRGNLTTLGRNGSDLTASLIAEAIGAREVQFWKSVAGVMTADPELVSGAAVIGALSWTDAAELAFHGAEVLHPAALAPARRAGCAVRLRDVRNPDAPGTRVGSEDSVGLLRADGAVALACRDSVLQLELELGAPELRGPRLAELFGVLERHRVEPGLISTSGERARVVVAPGPGVEPALEELGEVVRVRAGLAQIGLVVRAEERLSAALAQRCLDVLADAGVPIAEAFLGDRRSSQAFLVESDHLSRATKALHAGVFHGQRSQEAS